MSFLRRLLLLGAVLYLTAWAYRVYSRKYYIWLPAYFSWIRQPSPTVSGPVHLFFVYVDHFEPGDSYHYVQRWLDEYPNLADRHHDSDGRVVQHTWFYPAEQRIDRNLLALQKLVTAGYGEVELHIHHNHDTQETGRERFSEDVGYLQQFGFLKTPDGVSHFAFIHGNWGLDNSLGPEFCGNSMEIALLRDLGCFADFTLPTLYWESQPPMVNNIYAATDDPRPKSYDHGVPVQQGVPFRGDLMMFQGPLLMVPSLRPRSLFVFVEDGEIHPAIPVGPDRVDHWVRAHIHVKGRPDWQFVKVHTHGAEDNLYASETLGPHFDSALGRLETTYNDGTHYILHYITAREAFNLVRAAIDGKQGDPRQYYDYVVPPYIADHRAPASSQVRGASPTGLQNPDR